MIRKGVFWGGNFETIKILFNNNQLSMKRLNFLLAIQDGVLVS
jgi:hypothetical protein